MLASNPINTPATTNANERLTWPEICRRYPDEWVVVVEIQPVDEVGHSDELDEDGVRRVRIEECTAVAVAHGKNRKALSPQVKLLQQHHDDLGVFFTGRLIPPAYELRVP
jgi:hypothetical protein